MQILLSQVHNKIAKVWNTDMKLITDYLQSSSQEQNLNKSLPFFINNYLLISMLIDSNHVLHKHDTNHQGATTFFSHS